MHADVGLSLCRRGRALGTARTARGSEQIAHTVSADAPLTPAHRRSARGSLVVLPVDVVAPVLPIEGLHFFLRISSTAASASAFSLRASSRSSWANALVRGYER